MNRRKFITLTGLGGVSVGLLGTSIAWVSIEPSTEVLTSQKTLMFLDKLASQRIDSNGEWSPYKVLTHCAQSVDYSMDGYPEHKSDIFKNTIGKVAFAAFSHKRQMTHDLAEAIPSAPVISQEGNIKLAISMFRNSLTRFQNYQGALKPHFAYGKLSKAQYESAHAMHFVNHLKELVHS